MPGTFQRPPVMRVTLDQLQPVQAALAAALQTRFNQHNASDVRPDGSPCPCEHCTDLRWVLYEHDRTLVRLSNSSERARPCTPARDQAPSPTVHEDARPIDTCPSVPGVPSVCTRVTGHDGPCNGFPRAERWGACFEQRAIRERIAELCAEPRFGGSRSMRSTGSI